MRRYVTAQNKNSIVSRCLIGFLCRLRTNLPYSFSCVIVIVEVVN